MFDDGMLILPTHRIIGGLENFSIDKFKKALGVNVEVLESLAPPEEVANSITQDAAHTFGLYDAATKKCYKLKLINHDILKALEPNQSDAWRQLDVAILQRYLIDEILKPTFAGGKDPTKTYTADASQVAKMTDGKDFQIALMIRPTPLPALEELGKHNEVMPQKSTFFYPKLATGMMINPLAT
jgi:uncharacterized protein (DUF1015 family)